MPPEVHVRKFLSAWACTLNAGYERPGKKTIISGTLEQMDCVITSCTSSPWDTNCQNCGKVLLKGLLKGFPSELYKEYLETV